MAHGVRREGHRGSAVDEIDNTDVAEDLALGRGIGAQLLHLLVVARQRIHVLLDRDIAAAESLWHQRAHIHLREIGIDTANARKNHNLARHVGAVQIVARIGLRVPEALGLGHNRREGHGRSTGARRAELVEQEGQSARKDALDLVDAVARVDQIAQRVENGQPSAHGCLVHAQRRARERCRMDLAPELDRARECLFVRCCNRNALAQPLWVPCRNGLAACAVEQHGRAGELCCRSSDSGDKLVDVERLVHNEHVVLGALGRRRTHAAATGLGLEPHFARVGLAGNMDIARRAADLREQCRTDVSGANQADNHKLVVREARNGVHKEVLDARAMHAADRLFLVGLVDHQRDVALARALRNRADVHLGSTKGSTYRTGNTRGVAHAVADNCKHGTALAHLDRHELQGDFAEELLVENLARCFGGIGLHGKADRVLRRRLGDEDHRDLHAAQTAKEPLRDTGDADHSAALEIDQGDRGDGCNALDAFWRVAWPASCDCCCMCRAERLAWALADHGEADIRVECVAHNERDAVLDRGRHCLWMQHLGAKVGELHGLVVGNKVEAARTGHDARVGRVDAVNVGPDGDLARMEQGANDRARKVRAVAAERGWGAVLVVGHKSREHKDLNVRVAVLQELVHARLRLGPQHRCKGLWVFLNHDNVARVDVDGLETHGAQMRGKQRRLEHFACSSDRSRELNWGVLRNDHGAQQLFHFLELGIEEALVRFLFLGTGHERLQRRDVARTQRVDVRKICLVAARRLADDLVKPVGDLGHGRDDHGERAR
eukprot:comp21867_c0_seq1/m.49520 comp21867_c0_seq1/g.49520  ORF comp21867_c0_seq1/g.49520 comp21867_c0_seq1/m.49520 type:complete len:779 (-) comp21867_c0_seq1:129-2465(-)